MGIATKDLAAVGSTLVLNVPDEQNGTFTFQYPASAAGTVVPEVTLNNIDWVAVNATNINTGVAATSVAAAGIYFFEFVGYLSARVRKSVGTASCIISASVAFD